MKFSQEVLINLHREEVINKIEDPAAFPYWQRGFIYSRHLSGVPGKEGARYKLKFSNGKKDVFIIKTILKQVYPKKIHCTFETQGIFQVWKNFFESAPGNKTRWIVDTEYRFFGFSKFLRIFQAGKFKKQTLQIMEDFKAFAEEGKNVKDYNNE